MFVVYFSNSAFTFERGSRSRSRNPCLLGRPPARRTLPGLVRSNSFYASYEALFAEPDQRRGEFKDKFVSIRIAQQPESR